MHTLNLIKHPFYLILVSLLFTVNTKNLKGQEKTTQSILESFVEDYKTDPMALTVTFGIQIGDEWWHVKSTRKEEGYAVGKSGKYTFHNYGPNEVSLYKGEPTEPTWYFHLADRSVLDKIDEGIWTASTAAMRSFSSDQVALDDEAMDGYNYTQKSSAELYIVLEHFWKKGEVEITQFKRDNTLPTHGVGAVSLYTMKDKRIAWFSIMKDEAANTERGLDKGQVPNLFIITKGKGKADLGENEIDLEPGMSIFVPPYTKHIIYNPYDEPLEGILVLYGDNIDYAEGQSYMGFLENQMQFLEENQAAIKRATLSNK